MAVLKDIFVILGIVSISITGILVGVKHGVDIESIVTHSFTALGSLATGMSMAYARIARTKLKNKGTS